MKILKSYEDQHYGNDCMIYEEVALIESSNSYMILKVTTYKGWMGTESRYEEYQYDSYSEACKKYDDLEKEIKRWSGNLK